VLDEAGSREVLAELSVGGGDDLASLVECERSHAGSSGIDRDHHGHGGTVVGPPTGRAMYPPAMVRPDRRFASKQTGTFASGR